MNHRPHTPAPWQARFMFRMFRRVRESPGDLRVMGEPENDWPDACLCSAAPDLLAVAERLRDFALSGEPFQYPPGSLQSLDLAIRKAREGI